MGVTGYRIRRITDGTATPIGAAPANVTAFTVTGLTVSTSYTFDIQALDAAGNVSQPSARVVATTNGSARINLALYRPTRASSSTQSYGPGNAVDGSPHTYWESANNAFPQWLEVDLGAATGARDIVLTLPPAAAWATRTQTVTVQGSTNGTSYTSLLGASPYIFDPSTGNAATLTLPTGTTTRYLRLIFTGNTGWPAGQLSELRVYGV